MILDQIVARSKIDLEERKLEVPLQEVRERAHTRAAPRNALEALRRENRVHIIAEVKKASPSRGLLAPNFDPVGLAQAYAANGASVISVLTEPHFFQGAPTYLAAIKEAVDLPVLCKDFIYDEYQVYEARSWGADLILLICAILNDEQLRHLREIAESLGMNCLVEAHDAEEVRRAVAAGSKIIGINSRDLKTFKMYPGLIRQLRPLIPRECVLVAESGIHTAADARRLARYDVQAMLVGESLVTSQNIAGQLQTLLRGANKSTQVKICGISQTGHLRTVVEAGADLFGLVFYEPSHRYVTPQQARELVQSLGEAHTQIEAVGLFVNKEADYVNEVAEEVGLDIVQLHGTETPEYCQRIQRPVLKALHMAGAEDIERGEAYRHVIWRLLVDTPSAGWGGSGETHNWQLARQMGERQRTILAGGLHPDNVVEAIDQVRPWGVDVSSGVETGKVKDEAKIRAFVERVRTYTEQASRAL